MADADATTCPLDPSRDERKSARLAELHVHAGPGNELIQSFSFAREILRSPKVKQNGPGADQVGISNPEHVPVFYLDGELHKKRRAAITTFFTPKAIQTRYRAVMERNTERLITQLQASGQGQLDKMAFELAASVVSEIVGLSNSDLSEMAPRIATLLSYALAEPTTRLGKLKKLAMERFYGLLFYVRDVRPAVNERRKQRRDDIISQVLDKGYSERAIMIECLTYATAGMITTREFIVMVAWYMFERPELRERFLASDEEAQFDILLEILRLEPIAALVYRRVDEALESSVQGAVPAGKQFAIDLRAVNSDASVVGPCPYAFDPGRSKRQNINSTFMSFGDGSHRCPGSQVALHETRIFIERLLRVPGIRLDRAPDMLWNKAVLGYELRDAKVVCDRP